jgi:hypothetical protein
MATHDRTGHRSLRLRNETAGRLAAADRGKGLTSIG